MELVDTQVISYAMKGQTQRPLKGRLISSIVANEFLLVQSNDLSKARFYVPGIRRQTLEPRLYSEQRSDYRSNGRIKHMLTRRLSDRIVMDFGADFPPIVEYNNISIAKAINARNRSLFIESVGIVDKRLRKTIVKRFEFLLDENLQCVSISRDDVTFAFCLLHKFLEHNNLKSEFRNSWNDLLILANAVRRETQLVTEDNVLARFTANVLSAQAVRDDSFLSIAFANPQRQLKKKNLESKGYINRGWRTKFYKRGDVR